MKQYKQHTKQQMSCSINISSQSSNVKNCPEVTTVVTSDILFNSLVQGRAEIFEKKAKMYENIHHVIHNYEKKIKHIFW